ncbi:MAG: redoxin domain-containing protein [Prevotellaceae bacterium]|nr:redoxin domain-containing protein [Prevotellaceae bacterium]
MIVTVFVILIIFKIQNKKEHQQQLSFLPDICLKSIESEEYCLSAISREKPIMLLFMNLGCQDCINTLLLIINNEDIVRSSTIILILPDTPPQLASFVEKYYLLDKTKILIDPEYACFSEFQVSNTPTTFVYSKEHEFIQKILGEFSLTTLNKYLRY